MRGIEEMIQFQCDYEEGACPQILERLVETNLEQTVGYSEDEYCKQAREKIKKACDAPEADVHFLVGGTQTNYVVIRSILRPYQGVISAVTGHINVHETGAVEATGHKILALPSKDGKITASQVRAYYDAHWNDTDHEHIVQPGMVYIPIRRKMEQFTASLNYRNFTQPVKNLACHYSWTEQEWDMD